MTVGNKRMTQIREKQWAINELYEDQTKVNRNNPLLNLLLID